MKTHDKISTNENELFTYISPPTATKRKEKKNRKQIGTKTEFILKLDELIFV
jgi:hypothetical protein